MRCIIVLGFYHTHSTSLKLLTHYTQLLIYGRSPWKLDRLQPRAPTSIGRGAHIPDASADDSAIPCWTFVVT